MFTELARRIQAVLRDERGIETLEWIAMAVLIVVGVAVVVYSGNLPNAINAAITRVSNALAAA